MNMFYTGLGIARSLGEHGIPVIGLTAQRGIYGNFSRYSRTVLCADSRQDPETLLTQLARPWQGAAMPGHYLFPTRDHDLVFLDRFRADLEPYFLPVMPGSAALERCLNKWDTYQMALQETVATPRSWLIQNDRELQRAAETMTYPCVVKPLAAHHWRSAGNWELVGARKAIGVASREELMAEYKEIARAENRVLVQECIPGGDENLVVAACYVDRAGTFQAGFNARKLVQSPPGFGTGCVVESANRPELFERTIRLLRAMEFTGIAEVEYKLDARDGEYKLIEVNPRPWDQHRLGAACGVNLIHLAYCDYAGLPMPVVERAFAKKKWIAEETFILTVLRLLWRRERGVGALLRLRTRGEDLRHLAAARSPAVRGICRHAGSATDRTGVSGDRTLGGGPLRYSREGPAARHAMRMYIARVAIGSLDSVPAISTAVCFR